MMYYGGAVNEMTTSSKYPFYVELDDTNGLILGQHVYLQLENQQEAAEGLSVSSAFVAYDEDGSTYVWADKNGKLEKRAVEIGEYNMMNDTYQILEGLTEDDFIAFPDPAVCQVGAATTHDQIAEEIAPDMEDSAIIAEGEVA